MIKFKPEIFIVENNMNQVYEVLQLEIKKNKRNLSCSISSNGGLDITQRLVLGYLSPFAGHISKINLTAVNIGSQGKTCRIEMKRVNGLTYRLHIGLAIFLEIISISLILILFISSSKPLDFEVIFVPIFCVLYILAFEFFVRTNILIVKKGILKILIKKKIYPGKI